MSELSDEQWEAVEECLYAGRKIEAIKLFREATGADLKKCKELLDGHEEELREQFPDRFKTAANSGCGTAVLIGLIVTGLAVTSMAGC